MSPDPASTRRQRGAQPDNTNALKHGFYSRHFRALAEAELQAALSGKLDEEIAMLRMVVRQVFALANGVEQLDQGVKLLGALGAASIRLAKLLQTQKELGGDGDQALAALNAALGDVLQDWELSVVIGKNTSDHQLEWRRRSGGAIVSYTHTFSPAGPLGWFCMGMTFDIAVPRLKFFINDRSSGWRVLGETDNAALTAWGANPPDNPVSTVLAAGSSTLQEWIGSLAHIAVWNAVLSEAEMQRAMTL